MDYMKRVADEQLSMKMEAFGAALILGPKGCGKTTTGKHFSKSFVEFQDEDQRENLLLIANTKPSDLLKGEKPILFDEWQDAPKIWGAIRKDVDDITTHGLTVQGELNATRSYIKVNGKKVLVGTQSMKSGEPALANGDYGLF